MDIILKQDYKVLARKYRPQFLSDLKGQESVVRIITNAIKSESLHHAFLFTGIRGVGKTTIARIIARTINCTSLLIDEKSVTPCAKCVNCLGFDSETHPDIIEVDAASKTGVNDIREIIDNSRYMPALGKYKIYIIDEVHMLSSNAFNALLKTLEEPPSHIKFIFATTELKKIPITILSRCFKFDLKRLADEEMSDHLRSICLKESINIDDQALSLISNLSEGSVRDALSLLDQAVAYSNQKDISLADIRTMMGIVGRGETFDLIELLIDSNIIDSLKLVKDMYLAGKDPLLMFEELMEVINFISKIKIDPKLIDLPIVTSIEKSKGLVIADKTNIAALTILWQLVLKSMQDLKSAGGSLAALEMLIIRICYTTNLPTPGEILQQFNFSSSSNKVKQEKIVTETKQAALISKQPKASYINSFTELTKLFLQHKELIYYHHLIEDINLVKFNPGNIEMRTNEHVPKNFVQNIKELLLKWTQQEWIITLSADEGESTIKEQDNLNKEKEKKEFEKHPIIDNIIKNFPGSQINKIKDIVS